MSERLRRLTCECTGFLYRPQARVICVCGRECHQACSEVIGGAFHGPTCARIVNDGGSVTQSVPADESKVLAASVADRAPGALNGQSQSVPQTTEGRRKSNGN